MTNKNTQNHKNPSEPNHSHARNIRAGTVSFIVALVASFFCTPYVLDRIGDLRFSAWAILITIFGVSGLADVGLRAAFEIRLTRAWHKKKYRYINTTFATGVVLTNKICNLVVALTIVLALLASLTNFVSIKLHGEVTLAVIAMGTQLAITFKCFPATAVLTAARRFDVKANLILAQTTATAIATILCVTFTTSLGCLAVAVAAPSITINLIKTQLAKKHYIHSSKSSPSKTLAKIFIKTGIYRFASTASARVITQIDTLTVLVTCSLTSVAPYTLGASIAQRLTGITGTYQETLTGEVMLLTTQKNTEKLRDLLTKSIRYSALLMIPATTIAALYSHQFYRLWVPSSSNIPASQPAQIFCFLAAYSFITAVCLPFSKVIMAAEKHRQLAFACLAEASINLVLSFAFGMLLGMSGVAAATLIASLAIHLPVRMYICSNIVNYPSSLILLKAARKPIYCLLAFTPPVACLKYLLTGDTWISLLAAGAICVLVWATIAIAVGLNSEERYYLQAKVKHRYFPVQN